MSTTVEAYRPNFGKWESHFKSMKNAKSKKGKKKIFTIHTGNQTGSGVELVSPSQQITHMVEVQKKKLIKGKKKSKRLHSAAGAQRGNISKKSKKGKKTVKKTTKRKNNRYS